ncbi:MAG: TetR/AcrR family transcriptional regulator [Pyrinomonadaceae bacterium]
MSRSVHSNTPARSVVADKREAILRAGIKVFAGKGYFNSKVSDIAGEAGIADGTVYLYFKSKDEILHSIFDRAMAEFISEGKKELAGIPAPEDKLRRIAELHLEKLGADRDMAIVFQVELRGSTKFMQEFSAAGFAEYLDIIRETIEQGQKTGVFRDDMKAVVCAKILYGALDEMVTNWVLSSKSYPLAPMAGQVLKIFFGGIMQK